MYMRTFETTYMYPYNVYVFIGACLHVYTYLWVYVYIYIYIYIYIHTHTLMYVFMCFQSCTRLESIFTRYVYVCVREHVCACLQEVPQVICDGGLGL